MLKVERVFDQEHNLTDLLDSIINKQIDNLLETHYSSIKVNNATSRTTRKDEKL